MKDSTREEGEKCRQQAPICYKMTTKSRQKKKSSQKILGCQQERTAAEGISKQPYS